MCWMHKAKTNLKELVDYWQFITYIQIKGDVFRILQNKENLVENVGAWRRKKYNPCNGSIKMELELHFTLFDIHSVHASDLINHSVGRYHRTWGNSTTLQHRFPESTSRKYHLQITATCYQNYMIWPIHYQKCRKVHQERNNSIIQYQN